MAVDQDKLQDLMGRVVGDAGAAASAALVGIGDRLGLYETLRDHGPLDPAQLAERAGCAERYVREWLLNQAAGGYVTYDPAAELYSLSDEQASADVAAGLIARQSTVQVWDA